MAITFELTEEQLSGADLGSLTADLASIEKIEWAILYCEHAVRRMRRLFQDYRAGSVTTASGLELAFSQDNINSLKAEVNALADKMVTAQTYVANLTD